ncbi:MAG: hypothetical protein IT517_10830 [Burkholderiales bacterium]|nr:hypothetical protein [Burkholderiales bacterium]
MKHSIDVAVRVSPELSAAIEAIVNDPDRDEPPTLADALALIRRRDHGVLARDDGMHPQMHESLVAEIDSLVEEFGGEAPAIDFVAAKASECLSRIIEVAMENPLVRHEPTLGGVRDAMASGLTARLAGDGTIEPDEEQSLLAEIDALIDHYGRDAVAEEFVRFE